MSNDLSTSKGHPQLLLKMRKDLSLSGTYTGIYRERSTNYPINAAQTQIEDAYMTPHGYICIHTQLYFIEQPLIIN